MKTTTLVLASILFALLLCEAGLRIFTGFGDSHKLSQLPTTAATDKPLDVQDAARYIAQMPASPGTDRKWFTEDPPPLPNRTAPSPESVARFHDYERRVSMGPSRSTLGTAISWKLLSVRRIAHSRIIPRTSAFSTRLKVRCTRVISQDEIAGDGRRGAPGNVLSKAVIERIEIKRAPLLPPRKP